MVQGGGRGQEVGLRKGSVTTSSRPPQRGGPATHVGGTAAEAGAGAGSAPGIAACLPGR